MGVWENGSVGVWEYEGVGVWESLTSMLPYG